MAYSSVVESYQHAGGAKGLTVSGLGDDSKGIVEFINETSIVIFAKRGS